MADKCCLSEDMFESVIRVGETVGQLSCSQQFSTTYLLLSYVGIHVGTTGSGYSKTVLYFVPRPTKQEGCWKLLTHLQALAVHDLQAEPDNTDMYHKVL